jgi:hypothetical protein
VLLSQIGPETVMPVVSIIAAVAGVLVIIVPIYFVGRAVVRHVWPGPEKK